MTTPARDPRRWWVLAAAVASLVAVGVDSGAVVLALPTIRHALRLTTPEVVAVLAAPALTLGLLSAPAARAASRWGARRVLLLGLAGVGLGSLGAATAGSGSSLVAARVLTGAGGAAALPAALTVLVGAFDDDQRDRALAIWAAFGGLLLVAAPLAAGALVVHAGWRPVFGSAAGLAGVALLLTGWRVAPARGPTEALPASEPLEPGAARPRLAPVAVHAALPGAVLLLSFALQDGRHHSALRTAVLLLPLTVGLLVVGPRADRRVARYGPRRVTTQALLLTSVALAGHALPGDPLLPVLLLLQGIGSALVVAAEPPAGSRQLGTVVGVVLAGTALSAARTDDLRTAAFTAGLLLAVAAVLSRATGPAGRARGRGAAVARRRGAGPAGTAPVRRPSGPPPPASGR